MRVYNQLRGIILCALSLCVLPIISSSVYGTLISYSDVPGAHVNYTDIQENTTRLSIPTSSDPTPVFGQPTGSDSLGFPGLSFKATSTGNGFDLAKSILSMTINAKNNTQGISEIKFSELGDYTLARITLTADPSAEVKAIGWITVEEINGVSISPFVVVPNLSGAQFDNLFNLATDSKSITTNWSGILDFDITDAIRDKGYTTGYATKVSLSITNTLTASSDADSAALIEKGVGVNLAVATVNVPEPSTLIMLLIGALGLGIWRRNK